MTPTRRNFTLIDPPIAAVWVQRGGALVQMPPLHYDFNNCDGRAWLKDGKGLLPRPGEGVWVTSFDAWCFGRVIKIESRWSIHVEFEWDTFQDSTILWDYSGPPLTTGNAA